MTFFCSQQLAERIERAECAFLGGGVDAALRRDPDGGFFAMPLAGGLALWGGPMSPLGKIAGLGFGGPLEIPALEAVEAAYRDRGAAVRVELASLGDPEVGRQLTARGYLLNGFENVLGKNLNGIKARPHAEGISVTPLAAGEENLWLDAVVDGFAAPDEQGVQADEDYPREVLVQVISDLAAAASLTRYLARVDGQVAGGASLRIKDGIAQLAGAATLPAFRRRGVQNALLARRMADAAAAGCELAVITTQPGSKSQQNAQRQGFDLLYTRAVLVTPESGVS